VTHGHGGDCAALVTLDLAFEAGMVGFDYADSAPEHNPLDHFHGDCSSLATTLTMRPVGGHGTNLIGRLIETGRYRREAGRNQLYLSLPLEG
jgi:hypothetical protein